MGKNDTKHNKSKAETTFAQKANKKHTKSNNNDDGNKTSKSLQHPKDSLISTEDTDKLREQILSLGGTRGDVTFLQDIDNDDSADMITSIDDQSAVSKADGLDHLLYIVDLHLIIPFFLTL
jgi:hypothetical protein